MKSMPLIAIRKVTEVRTCLKGKIGSFHKGVRLFCWQEIQKLIWSKNLVKMLLNCFAGGVAVNMNLSQKQCGKLKLLWVIKPVLFSSSGRAEAQYITVSRVSIKECPPFFVRQNGTSGVEAVRCCWSQIWCAVLGPRRSGKQNLTTVFPESAFLINCN